MRILIVEDDQNAAKAARLVLEAKGHVIETAGTGEEAIDLARVYEYGLLILDLGLPDMEGAAVLRELRRARDDTPVLILTGDSDVESRVTLLNAGADDFVVKPYSREELVARVDALTRRSLGHAQPIIEIGNFAINITDKTVTASGNPVYLTGKEYGLLEALALRKGSAITKEAIMGQLYNGLDEPEMKIVDVFVCKLRAKLGKANEGEHHIETVWGRGYRIVDPVQNIVSEKSLEKPKKPRRISKAA